MNDIFPKCETEQDQGQFDFFRFITVFASSRVQLYIYIYIIRKKCIHHFIDNGIWIVFWLARIVAHNFACRTIVEAKIGGILIATEHCYNLHWCPRVNAHGFLCCYYPKKQLAVRRGRIRQAVHTADAGPIRGVVVIGGRITNVTHYNYMPYGHTFHHCATHIYIQSILCFSGITVCRM